MPENLHEIKQVITFDELPEQLNKVIKHENKGRIVIESSVEINRIHEKDIPLCEMSNLVFDIHTA